MRILVIGGSPHEHGSSNMLAGEFIRGAEEAGHEVEVFDAAKADLHPCIGCEVCGTAGPCTFDDDMTQLKDRIRRADLIAFVTPLYYFGVSTQLKCVIDRFYSFNGELTSMRKKTVLIVAGWDSMDASYVCIRAYYQQLCSYLEFQDQGMVIGKGCGTTSMTSRSKHLAAAYDLGKGL